MATPHYGGHIERLIGTIMDRVHLLPGTTGSNPQDKGAYPAEDQSVLTLAELERWLAIEICEQYHRRVRRGLRRSPLAASQEALRLAGGGLGHWPISLNNSLGASCPSRGGRFAATACTC